MRKLQISFDWLNYKDQDEMAWAIHYLTKAGWGNFDQSDLSNKEILNCLSNEINSKHQHEPAVIILLLKRMKGAKSARDHRNTKKKQHKKSYSFIMDTSIQSKLKNLAGDRPNNETLEKIINDVHQFKKEIEAKLRDTTTSLETSPPKPIRKNSTEVKLKNLTTLKKAQDMIIENILKDLCKYEYIVEKIHFSPFITTDDYDQIEKKYQKRKEITKTQIKKQIGFLQISLQASQIDILGDDAIESKGNN